MFLIGAKRRLGYALTGGESFLTDVPKFPGMFLIFLMPDSQFLNT